MSKDTPLRDGERVFIIPPATLREVGRFYCKSVDTCYRVIWNEELEDYEYESLNCTKCALYSNCPFRTKEVREFARNYMQVLLNKARGGY